MNETVAAVFAFLVILNFVLQFSLQMKNRTLSPMSHYHVKYLNMYECMLTFRICHDI